MLTLNKYKNIGYAITRLTNIRALLTGTENQYGLKGWSNSGK